MKIFFFITKSEQGGAQTHVAQLTKFFLSQGDQVAVMSAPGGWLEEETKRLGATFYPNAWLANSVNPLRLWKASRLLLAAVKNNQPDLVACHSTMTGLLGRFVINNRIPTIFTAHGWSFTQGTKRSRRVILPWLERLTAHFCSMIICVSKNDLQLARTHRIAPKEKLTVVYNGVETSESFASAQDDKNQSVIQRRPQADEGSQSHILFIGRLAPPKDPFLLLKSISFLPPSIRQRIQITFIGDGPQKPELQKAIREFSLDQQVELTGALTRRQVLERLKMADIFVLPTRYEGLPYSILEAMAQGLPVIASNVGGIKEAVGSDAGIMVPPNDPLALRDAIERLAVEPKLCAHMGRVGQERVVSRFNVQTMCERTREIYRSML